MNQKFTKSEAQRMRIDIAAALAEVEKKYNAKLKVGNISYGNGLKCSIAFGKVSENKNGEYVHTKEAQEFISRAAGMGLDKSVLGEKLMYQGSTYVITGYNTRARKNPVQFTVDGENYASGEIYMHKFVKAARPEFYL